MTSHVESKIFEGFTVRLAALTFSPVLPIAWPNVSFTPPAAGKYLRARHLPNTPEQISLGSTGFNRHVGLFQVDVVWPEGVGETAPKEIAGAIVAQFKRGTEFTRESIIIRIPAPPAIAPSIQDGKSYVIPVTIRYQADATNP